MTRTPTERERWAKIVRSCAYILSDDSAEIASLRDRITDLCVANPKWGVMHATWVAGGSTGRCGCVPCSGR
jgi:hypothetical protein